jgi:hypothetical protein
MMSAMRRRVDPLAYFLWVKFFKRGLSVRGHWAANFCNSVSEIRIFLKLGTRFNRFCRTNFRIETTLTDNRIADSRTSKSNRTAPFVAPFAADFRFSAAASELILMAFIHHE